MQKLVGRGFYGVLVGGNVDELHGKQSFGAERTVGTVSALKRVVC